MKRPSFLAVKLTQVLCVAYILILTFSYAPLGLRDRTTGDIIDGSSTTNTMNGVILVNGSYRPVVAQGMFEMICLGISRVSAFSLYPVMVLAFFSKCKATLNYLEKTPISLFMVKNEHKLHTYCGRFIAIDVWIHTIFHLLRWGHQGNIKLLWTCAAGLSGLVAVVVTPLITIFMLFCKTRISYEVRKGLHYLFYPFAIALCFHVPPSGIPNGGFIAYVLGFSIAVYTLDRMYVVFFMTERIDTSQFQALPSGVQMTMKVSDRFQRCGEKGGFGYVCLPWIDRQWHAFSLFQDPLNPNKRVVFMLDVGDWTSKVHTELQRNVTSRPVWIQGPFVSPYKMARDFDNQILVSTGIGITPALSVIESHKDSRTIYLIWSTREASLIEFFLENYTYLDHQLGFNFIFYTGKEPLKTTLLEGLPLNVKIINSRPNLEDLIPDIIHAHECSGMDQSQSKFQPVCNKCMIINDILKKSREYTEATISMSTDFPSWPNEPNACSPRTDKEKFQELVAIANDAGYDITDLSRHLRDAAIPCPFTAPMTKQKRRSSLLSRIKPSPECNLTSDPNVVLKRVHHLAGIWKPTIHASRSIKKMEHKTSQLSRWGIMYCGASSQVKGSLKSLSKEYDVDLHYESFAW